MASARSIQRFALAPSRKEVEGSAVLLLLAFPLLQDPVARPRPAGIRPIGPGQIVAGTLHADDPALLGHGPCRWFEFVPDHGGPVAIALDSFDFDAFLAVEGEGSERIAEADGGGVETNARLVLLVQRGKRYRIAAAAAEGETGDFALALAAEDASSKPEGRPSDAAAAYRLEAAERALARSDRRAAARHFLAAGESRHARGLHAVAKDAFDRARVLAEEEGDLALQAEAFANLGRVFYALASYPQALEAQKKALSLFRETGNAKGVASTATNLGLVYAAMGDFPQARRHYEEALDSARAVDDPVAEGAALEGLGDLHMALSDPAKALEVFQSRLDISIQRGDRSGEASARLKLGWAHRSQGDTTEARAQFEEAASTFASLGNWRGWAEAEGYVGQLLANAGEYEAALERYERSRLRFLAEEDRAGEMWTHGNLAFLHWSQGNIVEARRHWERQADLASQVGDLEGQSAALEGLGLLHREIGEYGRAVDRFENLLDLARDRDPPAQARALRGLAVVHRDVGDFPKSRHYYEQALALDRAIGDRAFETLDLAGLGEVYAHLGESENAQEYLERATAAYRESGNLAGAAWCSGRLGDVARALGDHAKALERYGEELESARGEKDLLAQAYALGNLGHVEGDRDDPGRARERYEEALDLFRRARDPEGEALALGWLAEASYELGDRAGARALASDSLAFLRRCEIEREALGPLRTLARVAIAERDESAALERLREAERLLERLPTRELEIAEASGLRSRYATWGAIAQDGVALRVTGAGTDRERRRDAIAEGFEIAGRWKGRALLEGIVEHRRGGRSAAAIGLRRDRQELLGRRDAVLERVSDAVRGGEPPEKVDAVRDEARALLAQWEAAGDRLGEVSARDATLEIPQGVGSEAVAEVLGPDVAFVEYAAGESRLYAYRLVRGELEFFDLGERASIRKVVHAFLSQVAYPETLGTAASVAAAGIAALERLLGPVLKGLAGEIRRLVVAPTVELAALPFEALVTGRKNGGEPSSFADVEFVLDRYEVGYAPSAPVLVELASLGPRRSPGKVLILADPTDPSEPPEAASTPRPTASWLPGETDRRAGRGADRRIPKTRDEALAIARLLLEEGDTDQLAELVRLEERRSATLEVPHFDLHLGAEASPKRLEGDLKPYAVLHVAAHGEVNFEFPQRTGIALAFSETEDGHFTIADALDLDLDANLVFLSACNTARGQAKAGEGVESLARAFLFAGARAVVASLWQVEDWAAEATTVAFYRAALRGGLPPAEALREAKRSLRRSEGRRGVATVTTGGSRAAAVDSGHPYFWAPFIYVGLPGAPR